MDEYEVIARLQDHFRVHDDGRPNPLLDEACVVAYQALEKQIPMKPQEINEERIRLDDIWEWSCGNCGRLHGNDYPLNYCNECGQKVDWSEWK